MKGNPFHRSAGGTVSRPKINLILPVVSLTQMKSEEDQLAYLAKYLASAPADSKAWRCDGLLADGIILVDGKYYIVELKTSMYFGSFTSALFQLIAGRKLISDYHNENGIEGISSDVKISSAEMLVVFSEFKAWEKEPEKRGWGQLCKHLKELPSSDNIGVIKTDFELEIEFPTLLKINTA